MLKHVPAIGVISVMIAADPVLIVCSKFCWNAAINVVKNVTVVEPDSMVRYVLRVAQVRRGQAALMQNTQS